MPIRAVIFDKDGTLIDFNRTWGRAAYHVFEDLAGGDPARIEKIAAFSKYDLDRQLFATDSIIFADATSVYGPLWAALLDEAEGEDFNARVDGLFHRHSLAYVTPFADTRETVSRLAEAGFVLGCVTNDAEACARDHLERIGIGPLFVDVIGYDSGHGRKPDSGQIVAFANRIGMPPGEIAVVGDSLHDLHASRAAGCLTIAVTTGGHGAEILAGHADHVLHGLAGLPALLSRAN